MFLALTLTCHIYLLLSREQCMDQWLLLPFRDTELDSTGVPPQFLPCSLAWAAPVPNAELGGKVNIMLVEPQRLKQPLE